MYRRTYINCLHVQHEHTIAAGSTFEDSSYSSYKSLRP
mgnify:CR=1 FL=1